MLSDLDPFWFLCLWHLCYQGISETHTDQGVWNSPEVVGEASGEGPLRAFPARRTFLGKGPRPLHRVRGVNRRPV